MTERRPAPLPTKAPAEWYDGAIPCGNCGNPVMYSPERKLYLHVVAWPDPHDRSKFGHMQNLGTICRWLTDDLNTVFRYAGVGSAPDFKKMAEELEGLEDGI